MTPLDDLHQLIHSLDRAELRYFKLHAGMLDSSDKWNYLKLFEAIQEQEEYNEGKIKALFEGSKIGKNLAVEKHYLYMQLLKALRSFRSRKQKHMLLRDMMDNVEILSSKGLLSPAWRMLRRAKKLAKKLDQPIELMELHILERRMGKLVDRKKQKNDVAEEEREGRQLVERLHNELEFHHLYDRFSSLASKGHDLRHTDRKEALTELLSHPNLQDADKPDSLHARTLFHQIKGTAAFLQGQAQESLLHYQQILEDWRQNPHAIRRHPRRFLRTLGNYMTGLENTGAYDAIPPLLAEIRKWKKALGIAPSHRDTQEYHFEVLYHANSGRIPEAQASADRLAGFFNRFEAKLSMGWKLPSAFNLSAVYFIGGDFRQALHWTNYIIGVEPTQQRKTIQHIARIFQLAIHYELGNLDLLEYLIRNSKTFLKRRGVMDRFEVSVLGSMKRLLDSASHLESKEIAGDLYRRLHGDFENDLPGLDELKIWSRARMEGREIALVAANVLKA